MSRTLNSVRNIIWAVIHKLVIIILPFVVRTVMISRLGAEYTGLNGLFTSILSMLSLAELGFSNAMVYCMYEPVHKNDISTICSLLNLYKKIYNIIGLIILGLGLALLPFLSLLIKGDISSDINIYMLYIIFLSNSVLSYFMFAYKSSLLTAYQRSDIISEINLIGNVLLYAIQILVLIFTKNFYIYAIMIPLSTISINLLYNVCSLKIYPEIKCKGSVDDELKNKIKKRVIGIMLYKFSSTTRTSFDSIVISSFLGLLLLTKYQNYFMIISSILGILSVISSSVTASVGNSIVEKSKEQNYIDFRKFVFIYMWLSGLCSVCILGLLQNFMDIWLGSDMLLGFSMVILFTIYFYSQTMGDIVFVYRTAAGLWWQDRIRPVVEAVVNIILNILFAAIWGIHGIILATILTLLIINFIWGAKILFTHYFCISMKEYLIIQSRHAFTTVIACIASYLICMFFPDNILFLIVRAILCFITTNIIYIIVYRKTTLFNEVVIFARRIVKIITHR